VDISGVLRSIGVLRVALNDLECALRGVNDISLIELFRSYGGGIAVLSKDLGVSKQTLYQLARGYHVREPRLLLEGVVSVFSGIDVGGKVTYSRVQAMWLRSRS